MTSDSTVHQFCGIRDHTLQYLHKVLNGLVFQKFDAFILVIGRFKDPGFHMSSNDIGEKRGLHKYQRFHE